MVDNIMPSGVAPYIPGGAFDRLTPSAVPGVYTDDISAYELVCKLIRYVNDFVAKVNSLGFSNNALAVAYTNLSAYVHSVLDGLDIPAAVREVFDQFINDGMFEEGVMLIIDKYFEEHQDIGSGIFVVNLNTDDSDNLVASNTSNEIANARASGKLVLLRYGAYITHVLAGESDDVLCFEPLLHLVPGIKGYFVNSNDEWSSFIIDEPLKQDDVINDLNSNETNKPLSAAQGAKLKRLIDEINVSENELRIVVEGESDFTEVKSGVDNGKCVFCLLDGMYLMPMVDYNEPGRSAMFAMTTDKKVIVSTVINSTWQYKEYLISFTDVLSLMTNTVDDKSTDSQIPTAKAVYESSKSKLDYAELTNAVNLALYQAKESGEFDGEDGVSPTVELEARENGIAITVSAYNHDVGMEVGATYLVRHGETGAKGDKGDTGASGADGKNGSDGYTPVRGTDYWTETDKAEIVAMVIESLGGNPIFGIVDENNNIIVNGNLPDGTYSVKYEMENGTTVNIGNLVLDTNVYYTVTNNLTNCVSSNSAAKAVQGGSYSATISAKSGYELKSIVVKMGGTNVSSTAVSGGKITIANVTGNIVITAVAEETVASYTNLAKNFTTGRFNSAGAVDATATAATACTDYIGPLKNGDIIRIKGFGAGTDYNSQWANASKANNSAAKLANTSTHYSYSYDSATGVITLTKTSDNAGYTYYRISGKLTGTTADVIITLNEPIV